jgi:hypothetical protein
LFFLVSCLSVDDAESLIVAGYPVQSSDFLSSRLERYVSYSKFNDFTIKLVDKSLNLT